MKSFVVLALVACVASQGMDLNMNYRFNPTHQKMSNFEKLLLKEKMVGQDVDSYNTGMDNTVVGESRMELYSFNELMMTPLFREYLSLPYFQQLWKNSPRVFMKYVESPLFQQFWMIPQFQMYFRNPVLYVKYIVPQLQVISEVIPFTTEGKYNYDTPTYNVPYAYRHHNQWSIPMSMDKTFNMNSFPYTTSTTGTNYRYLLEKMMNHMNVNKQDLETVTDVKMLPSGKVFEKTLMVDPITGKLVVGDHKSVEKKIVPVKTMDFPYGLETLNNNYHYGMNIFNTQSTKDAVLKHIILQKILGNRRIPTSVYETLFKDNEEIFNTPEIYNTIYKNKNVVEIPEMLETILGNKVFSGEYETLFKNKNIMDMDMSMMTPEVLRTVFGQKIHEIKMTPESLETIFGKTIYNPTVYDSLFDEKWTVPEHTYEPYMTREVSPFVTRMLKNNKISKFQKFETEKMIEEIKKEKMMEQLIKEYPKYNKETIEFPKMFETEQGKIHIPLTFKTPVSGSILQGFEQEKEIKY